MAGFMPVPNSLEKDCWGFLFLTSTLLCHRVRYSDSERKEDMATQKEIREFFFRAMQAGWISTSPTKISFTGMPGYIGFKFRFGSLTLIDCYCVVEGTNRSFGSTTITEKGKVVWTMQYGGEYPPEAIPIVKLALSEAYRMGQFIGGRGVRSITYKDYLYVNTEQNGGGDIFFGEEKVISTDSQKVIGFHRYHGMRL